MPFRPFVLPTGHGRTSPRLPLALGDVAVDLTMSRSDDTTVRCYVVAPGPIGTSRHSNDTISVADYVPQETMFWRRSIWDKVGGCIDDSFHFAMDWDLILRFIANDARMVRLPRFLGAFRVHPMQKTSAQIDDVGAREVDLLLRRVHGREVTEGEIRRRTKWYLRQHVVLNKLYRAGLLRY
jgi:hypothetical protein